MRLRLPLLFLLALLLASAAFAQTNWNPTGMYSGNFIACQQVSIGSASCLLASSGTSVYRSNDSGVTWTALPSVFGGNTVYCFYSFTPTYLPPYTCWAGTSNGIYATTDGTTWTPVTAGGAPTGVPIYTLATPGAGYILAGTSSGVWQTGSYGYVWSHLTVPANTVSVYSFAPWMMYGQSHTYAGTSDGIYRSDGAYGSGWFAENNASTAGKIVNKIVDSGSYAWAAVWNPGSPATPVGIFKSPNSSAWAAASTGLGDLNVSGLVLSSNLYAATGNGVWESTDAAASWHTYNTGLPSGAVGFLAVGGSSLYCGPAGNGIYKKGAPILLPLLVSPANNAVDVPVNPTLTWSYPAATPAYYDLQYSTSSTFASNVTTISNIVGNSVQLSNLTSFTNYYWKVRAFVNGYQTAYSTAFTFRTINTAAPPTTPTAINFTPASPLTADNIVAAASGSVDPNPGDVVSYQYQWRVSNDGGVNYTPFATYAGGTNGNTILAADTVKGQKWQCQARATDGTLFSDWFISPTIVTIGDTGPTAPTNITFSPAIYADTSEIVPTASGSTDADNDAVYFSYQWAVSTDGGANFSDWVITAPTLAAEATQSGQVWKCQARAHSAALFSAYFESPTQLAIVGGDPPTVPTTSSITPLTPLTLDNLTADASGSTHANPLLTVTYEFQWSINSGPWGHDGQVLDNALSSKGDTVQMRARAVAGGYPSAWTTPVSVTIRDTPPADPTGVAVTPDPALTGDALSVTATSSDVDGDPITYEVQWRVTTTPPFAGTFTPDYATSTADPSLTTKGQTWQAQVRAVAGGLTSNWVLSSNTPLIGDSPPTDPGVSILPAAPTTNDILTANITPSTDADGDPISYRTEWAVLSGGLWNWVAQDTVPASQTTTGDHWKCRVQAYSGSPELTSAWVESAEVVIGNTAPTVPTVVRIAPATPTTTDNLMAAANGSTDPDGTTPSYSFEWSKLPVGGTWSGWAYPSAVVTASGTMTGEQWKVRARAFDGIDYSAWVESLPVTIGNTAPTAPTLARIAPTSPLKTDNLMAAAKGATDVDGNALSYSFEWAKLPVGGTWSAWAYPSAIVTASGTLAGQQWKVRARAFDGTAYGPWTESAPVTIGYVAPTAPTLVRVSPATPVDTDNLLAAANGSKSSTGGPVTYSFMWAKLPAGSATWSAWAYPSSIVTASGTRVGDQWKLQARAFDGTAYSPWVESAPVTIAGVAPAAVASPASDTVALAAAVAETRSAGVQVTVSLSAAASVEVTVCNLAGRVVGVMAPRDLEAGTSTLLWNKRSCSGTTVPAGMYLVQVTARTEGGGQMTVLAPLSLGR